MINETELATYDIFMLCDRYDVAFSPPFLKLTGDEDLRPVIETLKRTLR